MKSEERHRLESNWLATNMPIWGEKLRPYTSAILFAIAAAFGLYAVLSFWNARSASREAEAWNEYEMALLNADADLSNVRRVANNEELAGARMQDWAYVAWADRQVLLAAQRYLIDRAAATERLGEIKAIYETYVDQGLEDEIRNRARFGIARINELQNDMDDARKNYALVEGALAPIAAARLKQLEERQEEIGETVEWLATATLPTATMPAGGGTPGVRPGFDALPPATGTGAAPLDPSDMFDELLGSGANQRYGEGDAAAESAPASGEPAAEEPGTSEAEGASSETPAASTPADTAPAESTPPADASAEPSAETPTEPAADAPAEPATAEPSAVEPAEPAAEEPAAGSVPPAVP